MTGKLCAFILTKSSNLLLYYFSFFLHMYDYAIIDSGYSEESDYVGGFNPGDACGLIASLSGYLW
jgi:hypothetical protein